MQTLDIVSAFFGLLGTVLLAMRGPRAGWGFVAYLVSNIGWLVFARHHGHQGLFWQQCGFLAMSLWGIWTWLLRPALQPQGTIQPRELRVREAVDLSLEVDFVELRRGEHVVHTSAPVTFDCLRSLYLMGEETGIALERQRAAGGRL